MRSKGQTEPDDLPGFSLRIFVMDARDQLRRIPRTRWNRAHFQNEPLPMEFADQRLRHLEVACEIDRERRVTRVLRVLPTQIGVKATGHLDLDASMRTAIKLYGGFMAREPPSPAETIEYLEAQANHFWLPTPAHLEALASALGVPVADVRHAMHLRTPVAEW
jgi:hypothetical protein